MSLCCIGVIFISRLQQQQYLRTRYSICGTRYAFECTVPMYNTINIYQGSTTVRQLRSASFNVEVLLICVSYGHRCCLRSAVCRCCRTSSSRDDSRSKSIKYQVQSTAVPGSVYSYQVVSLHVQVLLPWYQVRTYHSGRKCKNRLVFKVVFERRLYFRP